MIEENAKLLKKETDFIQCLQNADLPRFAYIK
jgi:hypothetical protein